MKLVRMFGVTAMLALTAMAFIGASSASAEVLKAVFCKKDVTLCAKADLWGTDLTVKAHSSEAVLLGSLPVTCESDVTVLTGKESAHDIEATTTSLTWSNCKGCTTVTTTKLPKLLILTGPTPLSGTMDIVSEAVVSLKGCTIFNISCTATVSSGSLGLTGGAIGSTATTSASEVKVGLSGGLCGTEGKWDAGSSGSKPYVIGEVSGAKTGDIFLSEKSHA
ncbi:MAG TPA: hypothetical protein VJQ84_00480 [Solirubrobacterales bacterium]|nr:hypothetical protein [Solirubrobacterales bacterium]